MKYENVVSGKFISRPNRFIAHIEIDGKEEICHVMNTGRMKELLLPGAEVFLCRAKNPERKTKFDLIGVRRTDGEIINIDSIAPNIHNAHHDVQYWWSIRYEYESAVQGLRIVFHYVINNLISCFACHINDRANFVWKYKLWVYINSIDHC